MLLKKIFYFYLYILFIKNFSIIFCILEIPIYPTVVKGDFNKNNSAIINSEKSFIQEELPHYDIGNAEINKEFIFLLDLN